MRAACFGRDDWPTVSVVMPIRNEAEHLERAVESILKQHYPLPFDICLAVAPSDDGTELLAKRLASGNGRVKVVSNPLGVTPAGLNAAIAATTGEVVVRVDGHSALSEGYIRRAVETMRLTGAVNVGGIQDAKGETPFEEAVAAAMTSWLGTGGSRFHVGGAKGSVDTVYLGVFDRAAGDTVGWFDERLVRNQDYELNIRLRKAGGTVWFDPELSVSYRPRGSIKALAKQYHEYGKWKAVVARKHPGSLRVRQVVPAAVTVAIAIGLIGGLRRPRLLIMPFGYAALVVVVAATREPSDRRCRLAAALACSHLAWGFGFLRSTFVRRQVKST
jgi:succinoglycan biosynthesis protein ExoA